MFYRVGYTVLFGYLGGKLCLTYPHKNNRAKPFLQTDKTKRGYLKRVASVFVTKFYIVYRIVMLNGVKYLNFK